MPGKYTFGGDGETVAGRKYASDYRLEQHILPNGKPESIPVYQGAYFEFAESPDRLVFLRRWLFAGCGGVFLLLLPLLMDNTRLGRTVYVVLPAAVALLPLGLLLAGALRLRKTGSPFIREHRDKTDHRIRGASVALTALLAASCIGCVGHFLINGFLLSELFAVVCLFLALMVSCGLLRHRKLAATKEVKN